MAVNLVELAKEYLIPDVLQKAASFVGESQPATQKAMSGIFPTLIAALANQASTTDGAEKLSRTLDAGNYDGVALNSLGGLFAGGDTTQKAITEGKNILSSLFGSKSEGLADQIGRFASVRLGSASSLLALAVPFILNLLGRQRATIGRGPAALASLLSEQKSYLSGLLPAGIASFLGWSGYERARQPEPAYAEPKRETSPWLTPLLVLGAVVLVALAWLWGRPTAVRETTVASRPAGRMTDLALPGGMKISVPEGSFNYSLNQWLAGNSDTSVPKRFVFDNLNFETGSTQLTADSVPTVESLVAIMKAYPNVAVRLEGYTDNTGDADANKKLSLDRAVAVKAIMVKDGIAEVRIIGTDGYGQEKPIASNDTEEGRAKNRRTELVVEKR